MQEPGADCEKDLPSLRQRRHACTQLAAVAQPQPSEAQHSGQQQSPPEMSRRRLVVSAATACVICASEFLSWCASSHMQMSMPSFPTSVLCILVKLYGRWHLCAVLCKVLGATQRGGRACSKKQYRCSKRPVLQRT